MPKSNEFKNLKSQLGAFILGEIPKIPRQPTGITKFDLILNNMKPGGGLPIGRITEFSGWNSTAKTLIALHAIAEAQKKGGVALYLDTECALDPEFAKVIGVKEETFFYKQPEDVYQVLEECQNFCEKVRDLDIPKVLVWDSVAATQSQVEGNIESKEPAVLARVLSKGMQTLPPLILKANVTTIFINQKREKIGVLYGDPTTTYGGNALRFAASLRVEMKKGKDIVKDGKVIGKSGNLKLIKSKICRPQQSMDFDIFWDKGIVADNGYLEVLIEHSVINKSGAWLKWRDNKFRKADFDDFLQSEPELQAELRALGDSLC